MTEGIRARKVVGPASPADRHANIAQRSAVRFDGSRILLVDDNAINRDLAYHLLSALGLRVEKANDGREAVDKARHNRYAAVLMDIRMPRMDGLQATRLLRTLPRWHDVPIVAMTAHAFADERNACLAAGMNDLVTKPVDPDALLDTLLRWLPTGPDDDHDIGDHDIGDPAMDPAMDPAHGDTDATGVLERLRGVPGFDLAHGLCMVLGRSDRLLELLRRFVTDHGADADAIRSALENGDPETAHRLAHSLRGAAAVLGAFAVTDAAEEVEEYIMTGKAEAGPDLAGRLTRLAGAFAPLAFLTADQGPAAMLPAGQVTPMGAKPGLRDLLRTFLVAGDIRAIQLLASDSDLLRGLLGQQFGHFANALQRFEYEAAVVILDSHVQQVGRGT
jgi:CheY-like chemotaxis protein